MTAHRILGRKSLCIVMVTLLGCLLCTVIFLQGGSINTLSQAINRTLNRVLEPTKCLGGEEQSSSLVEGRSDNLHSIIDQLGKVLEKKVAAAALKKVTNLKPSCDNKLKIANSCGRTCLQKELPENVTARVEQLVAPRQLQMSPEEHALLRGMGDKINGSYDVILLTASSSNHYLETQAMLKNLHENVYPYLKNFTLVFYNLGLTEQERAMMVKYCKCQVMDFPFDKFPDSMSRLGCYSWKPIVIKAHVHKANVVFWMDASIRFHNSSKNLHDFINRTRDRGVQVGASNHNSPFLTYRSMFHFFGDEPCAHLNYGQAQATYGVYHSEYFVDRVILEPWVACAINEDCMCPNTDLRQSCTESFNMDANRHKNGGPIIYGMCHRFDQSAISLILQKIYQDIYPWVMTDANYALTAQRDNKVQYFPATRK